MDTQRANALVFELSAVQHFDVDLQRVDRLVKVFDPLHLVTLLPHHVLDDGVL